MFSSPSPSQNHPAPLSVQLPRELWCDITARILGDYLYDLIIGTDTRDDSENENEAQRPPTTAHAYQPRPECEWDAIATLLHTSRLVRACTRDHLSSLCHVHVHVPLPPASSSASAPTTKAVHKPPSGDEDDGDYRPLVAHLRALRADDGIDTLVLEEWDYAPGARFFGLPRSLAPRAEWEREWEEGEMPPVLVVLARLRHTLAASDAFAREGWDWFPHNAPEVYDVRCTALLVEAYRAVPAYARAALLGRVVERIAALQVARITCCVFFFCEYCFWVSEILFGFLGLVGAMAIEKTRCQFEMTQSRLGAKYHVAHPAVRVATWDGCLYMRSF